ncbi:hypothetical protein B0O99DRAFT_633558, partial [Bisporella sp. PMI_857]
HGSLPTKKQAAFASRWVLRKLHMTSTTSAFARSFPLHDPLPSSPFFRFKKRHL